MTAAQHSPHAIIIGGGITGLATAYYLQKQAAIHKRDFHYTLIEQSPQFGGKVVSYRANDFVIEGGPDSMLTQKPWALTLCEELGLSEQLMGTNDAQRNVFILHKGKLCPLPEGWRLAAPTQLLPFLKTPLLSPWGKLRAAFDLWLPPRQSEADESLADFITRRLGKEVLDQLAAPLMAGIHIADPNRLSIQSTFERYPVMEKKYGSLIKGTLTQMKAAQSRATAAKPMFMSLKNGMGNLIDALVACLQGTLLAGQAVTTLNFDASADQPYEVRLANDQSYRGDAVVLAMPAYAASALLAPSHPDLATALGQIRYLSSATISLAYHKDDVHHPLDGFGFVVPKTESCRLMACTWTSTKFQHRVPNDQVLIRVFVGGYAHEALVDLSDENLITLVKAELAQIMGIQAEPAQYHIYRWPKGTPQYDVGHQTRVANIEQLAQTALPGLFLTGSAFHGVGIPDCVRQGAETAEKAWYHLNESSIF